MLLWLSVKTHGQSFRSHIATIIVHCNIYVAMHYKGRTAKGLELGRLVESCLAGLGRLAAGFRHRAAKRLGLVGQILDLGLGELGLQPDDFLHVAGIDEAVKGGAEGEGVAGVVEGRLGGGVKGPPPINSASASWTSTGMARLTSPARLRTAPTSAEGSTM